MPEEKLWFTRSDAASLCGLKVRQFGDAVQPKLPREAVKKTGNALRLHGPAVVAAYLDYRKSPGADDEADPLLTGADSPALERYRIGRARMVEMDLAERERETVLSAAVRDALKPAVVAMRATGDRLARQFGNEAADIFNEGVSEFEAAAVRAVERATRRPGDDGSDNDNGRGDAVPPAGGADADAPPADAD